MHRSGCAADKKALEWLASIVIYASALLQALFLSVKYVLYYGAELLEEKVVEECAICLQEMHSVFDWNDIFTPKLVGHVAGEKELLYFCDGYLAGDHVFHEDCLFQSQNSMQCPLCRTRLRDCRGNGSVAQFLLFLLARPLREVAESLDTLVTDRCIERFASGKLLNRYSIDKGSFFAIAASVHSKAARCFLILQCIEGNVFYKDLIECLRVGTFPSDCERDSFFWEMFLNEIHKSDWRESVVDQFLISSDSWLPSKYKKRAADVLVKDGYLELLVQYSPVFIPLPISLQRSLCSSVRRAIFRSEGIHLIQSTIETFLPVECKYRIQCNTELIEYLIQENQNSKWLSLIERISHISIYSSKRSLLAKIASLDTEIRDEILRKVSFVSNSLCSIS